MNRLASAIVIAGAAAVGVLVWALREDEPDLLADQRAYATQRPHRAQ